MNDHTAVLDLKRRLKGARSEIAHARQHARNLTLSPAQTTAVTRAVDLLLDDLGHLEADVVDRIEATA